MASCKKPTVDWVRGKTPDDDDKKLLVYCERCEGGLAIKLPMSIDAVAKITKVMVNEHRHCKEQHHG